MALNDDLEHLIYGSGAGRRYTQDSPVMPDVWLAYLEREERVDLLLTPQTGASPGDLVQAVHDRTKTAEVAPSDTYVVARLSFEELVTVALPLTVWWQQQILGPKKSEPGVSRHFLRQWLGPHRWTDPAPQLAWLLEVVRKILVARGEDAETVDQTVEELLATAAHAYEGPPLLWQVSRNREVKFAIWASRPAIKADAACTLFNIDCSSIVWAVIDSGVDATHPGLSKRQENGKTPADPATALAGSRVQATYDFTKLRTHLDPQAPTDDAKVQELKQGLTSGRSIDWGQLESLLNVPHDGTYPPPVVEHGTHVAGILTADWKADDPDMPENHDLVGMAPGLRLYDLRVISDTGGDEFSVIAALQFIRWLNGYKDKPVIHGVNLSLSIQHDFRNYACGKTPVCLECERLAATGVVVVAAAGNSGFATYQTLQGAPDPGFRSASITDPGNAESVITVGGTHRSRPFSYGVSYFSSRGPTGDGRYKPDLVAPGEKILSLVPSGGTKSLDGTSMAAPHVSGAAALMLARSEELVGDPVRVKKIICQSATDLGRDRYFQGAGMLDVLRALQAV